MRQKKEREMDFQLLHFYLNMHLEEKEDNNFLISNKRALQIREVEGKKSIIILFQGSYHSLTFLKMFLSSMLCSTAAPPFTLATLPTILSTYFANLMESLS